MVKAELVSMEQVERIILVLRGHRVILDAHLAALYGVTTSNLNKAVCVLSFDYVRCLGRTLS